MKVSSLTEARQARPSAARAREDQPTTLGARAQAPPATGTLDLERVFFEHARRVRGFLLRLGVGAHDVDDLVSETFLIAHERRSAFDPSRPPIPWLFGIAFNRVRRYRRRAWLFQLLGSSLAAEPPPPEPMDLERRLIQAEDVDRVRRVLAGMRPDRRALLVMRDLEDLSTQEMAVVLEIPVGSVYSGLHHARQEFLRAYRRLLAREARHE